MKTETLIIVSSVPKYKIITICWHEWVGERGVVRAGGISQYWVPGTGKF